MRSRLYGVRVEEHTFRLAESSDLRDRLYSAHLVVCEHYAYQRGVISDGILDVLYIHDAVGLRGYVCDLKALFFQLFHCVKNSVVFYVERNEMLLALRSKSSCRGQQSLIIGLRAAACEIHLIRFRCVYALRDYLSCFVQNLLRALTVTVKAVRVAVELIKTLDESVSCRLAEICSRGIVSIYFHHDPPESFFMFYIYSAFPSGAQLSQ